MKRTYKVTVELDTENIEEAESKIKMLFVGRKVLDIKNIKELRSNPQNSSIHLWLKQISDECNEQGITMKMLLSRRMEVKPTMILLKESLWKVAQKKMFNKKSTTQLFKSGEINDIVDVITLYITELTKGQVQVPPFPNEEGFYRNNQS